MNDFSIKQNYSSFCEIFENLFIICAGIFIIIIKLKIGNFFDCPVLTVNLKVQELNKIIFKKNYNHYLQKNSELKKSRAEVKIKI